VFGGSERFGRAFLGSPCLRLTPLASPIAKAATAVECVRRHLAVKHRPPVAPPAGLARSNIQVCRIATSRAVGQACRLSDFGSNLPAGVVDDLQAQPSCEQQYSKVGDASTFGSALDPGHDGVGNARTRRELALTEVGQFARGSDVPIRWKFVLHAPSLSCAQTDVLLRRLAVKQ
jgi:hypothetical protein